MDNMTKREFLEAVISLIENVEEVPFEEGAVENADTMMAIGTFAKNELDKMDTANKKRREKSSEKAKEKEAEVQSFVSEYMNTSPDTASTLMGKMVAAGYTRSDGKDLNVQFVSSMARQAVKLGLAEQTEVKVSGKGTQKAYTRIV